MDFLPDILEPRLRLVVCGLNVGQESRAARHYFSNSGNRFWRTLRSADLTPRQLSPEEDRLLPRYGIGLTDLMKSSVHGDGAKPTDADRERLRATILRYEPKVVAFLGKAPARGFLQRRTMEWGLLPDCVGDSRLAVVPDTSGGNGHFERLKHYWRDVAEALAE